MYFTIFEDSRIITLIEMEKNACGEDLVLGIAEQERLARLVNSTRRILRRVITDVEALPQ